MGFFLYYSALRVADLNCSRKVYMAFHSVSYITDHNFSQKLKKNQSFEDAVGVLME